MADRARSSFYLIFLGVLLGFAISSFLAPHLILWYSEPPYQLGVSCRPAIDWALTHIVYWQIAGMFIFSIGLWTLSVVVLKKRVKEEEL